MVKVVLEESPPSTPYEQAIFNDDLQTTYYCYTRNPQNDAGIGLNTALPAVSGISNANPGVITFAANHGLHIPSTPRVTISGLTGGWASVNGSRILQPVATNTAQIVGVDTSGLGAVAGSPVVSTLAPRLSDNIWAIKKEIRDANGMTIFTGWAEGTTARKFRPDQRTSYAYY